jgi:hypothetical protein
MISMSGRLLSAWSSTSVAVGDGEVTQESRVGEDRDMTKRQEEEALAEEEAVDELAHRHPGQVLL